MPTDVDKVAVVEIVPVRVWFLPRSRAISSIERRHPRRGRRLSLGRYVVQGGSQVTNMSAIIAIDASV